MSDERTIERNVPAVPVPALRVRVVEGPDRGAVGAPEADAITVGTAESNDLVLRDRTVSRFHLELRRRGGALRLRDHGSTNGTRIAGVLVRDGEVSVDPGSVLALGDTRL